MQQPKRWITGAAIAVATLGIGAGVASASGGGGESSQPITGAARTRAESVALAATHGGKVTGTEISDEESRYEVEVTKTDGSVVDVQLDRGYQVVGTKADSERDR